MSCKTTKASQVRTLQFSDKFCILESLQPSSVSCRTGVVPLDSTSDVAGPIARTVEDAVRVLEVTVGVDSKDNLTTLQRNYTIPTNYTQFLQADALQVTELGFSLLVYGLVPLWHAPPSRLESRPAS